jgi:hypothetical protein
MNKVSGVVSKDKHYVSVEIQEFYSTKKEQFEIEVEKGVKPTLGDYVAMFKRELGIDMEIKSMGAFLEFKPTNPVAKGVKCILITKTTSANNYIPVSKSFRGY